MSKEFVSILRKPDYAFGAVENSPFRFEEGAAYQNASDKPQSECPVEYQYVVGEKEAKVIVHPGKEPVKYLKLRFAGDMTFVRSVYGDQWERNYNGLATNEWTSLRASRVLPWFCYLDGGERFACYGVKTGANCFAYWQVDTKGVTLFLNLCCGNDGTALKESVVAVEVVEYVGETGEDAYRVACKFASLMCEKPVLPKQPIFGVNNWYWAYGRISEESVLQETDYLMEMTKGACARPYMIIDDGWQMNRTYSGSNYIGGPWIPNDRFPDMQKLTDAIHAKGANTGIWFRPLLTLGEIPQEALLAWNAGGQVMDPSHPYTLERVEQDARRIRDWGFDMIKHDFTTFDLFGSSLQARIHNVKMCSEDRKFFDNTRTTAMIVKELYQAVQKGAGEADVIGCNVVGHLAAGIHSIYRVGDDTSGRSFEWTVANGINSMMRLPLNERFYLVDPDCAAFTEKVPADKNLDFLEMCALTGVTTLASVTPGSLKPEEMERIRKIFCMAAENKERYGICHYDKTSLPEIFVSEDGSAKRDFNWMEYYHGSRNVVGWFE